jgi:23S rRNA (uridine2552-2'-O)-methyltransferase
MTDSTIIHVDAPLPLFFKLMPQPRKLHDKFFKQAKAEGYAARSAYKLIEINDKKRLIRAGARVLDLGCAPGSWLQVVERIVGPRGAAVGIDLQKVDLRFGPNVHVLQADAFTIDAEQLTGLAGGLLDVVISDMAPSTTGHGDDFLSVRLCRRVLELLPRVLRPGGGLVMKVLEGEEFPALLKETKRLFREAGATKPAASRDVSREIFIVGSGYSAPAVLAAAR